MTTSTNANSDLADYLHLRLRRLEQFNSEIEEKICDERIELCRKIDEGAYEKNDPAIGRIVHHLEFVFGNTFRYTLLVGLCSFLEEAVKEISKHLVNDYDAKIKAKRTGNWLVRHGSLLTDAGVDLSSIEADLRQFHDFITLRNCVVHEWGKVFIASNRQSVESAVSRIETAEIFKDGYLYLGDQVVPEAIIAAEKIAEHVLVSQFNVSMT